MTSYQEPIERAGPAHTENHAEQHHWIGAFFVGVLSMILGAFAILYPPRATLAAALAFGGILFVTGVAQLVHAFGRRNWSVRGWMFVEAALTTAVGVLMFLRPLTAVLTLTLMLGIYFLTVGVIRAVIAVRARSEPGFGILLASAILEILLGIFVFSRWPQAGAWLLGTLLGVDLIVHGFWLVSTGRSRRITLPSARSSFD